jgi:hypothetical protein
MAELKTKATTASVSDFLAAIDDDERRKDCTAVSKLMQKATGAKPRMWGPSIVGFGDRRLKYDSGRELDWFVIGFSPRKRDLTLYNALGSPRRDALLKSLGKHTTGKGCLYIKRLADVDLDVLKTLIEDSVKESKSR